MTIAHYHQKLLYQQAINNPRRFFPKLRNWVSFWNWLVITVALMVCCGYSATGMADNSSDRLRENQAEVLRDTYGVPHIFAGSLRAAAFSWGYVHAEDKREDILAQIYAGIGQSASVYGRQCATFDCLWLDAFALTYDIPDIVNAKFATLNTESRIVLEAYAEGINYFFTHLQPASSKYVMPVTAEMVAGAMGVNRILRAIVQAQVDLSSIINQMFRLDPGQPASNQYAATGERTRNGTTIFGSDPHSSWAGFRSEPHIHIHFDDYDIVGASGLFIGPEIECGGNNYVHYGCTSLAAAATAAVVRAEVSEDGTAYFDHQVGGFVPFDQKLLPINIAGENFTFLQLNTRFGPVYKTDAGDVLILKIFSAGDISNVDYLVGRWLARSADEFVALFNRSTPAETGQNRVFASADRIGYIYGAYVPVLNDELDWSKPVSSADPRMEWSPEQWFNIDGIVPELPYVVSPLGDFAQNCNGHPAWSTEPVGQIPVNIPRYLHPQQGPTSRGQRMRLLLSNAHDLDITDAQSIITDVRSQQAEAAIEAIRLGLNNAGITDPATVWGEDVGQLVNELLNWRQFNDYQAAVDSEAMTVLYHFIRIAGKVTYPTPGSALTIEQLNVVAAVLKLVATYMKTTYASLPDPLRVPWGYVNRVRIGDVEVGLAGAPSGLTLVMSSGVLRSDGRMDPNPRTRGGSFMMRAASFGPNGFEHSIAVARGQIARQIHPNSAHIGQTLKDFANRKLRRIWLKKSEVEANLCPFDGQPGHEHAARTLLTIPG